MKNNNYMVVTTDYKYKIKDGFETWEEAYHWSVNHDCGQYDDNGGLRVCRNFKV